MEICVYKDRKWRSVIKNDIITGLESPMSLSPFSSWGKFFPPYFSRMAYINRLLCFMSLLAPIEAVRDYCVCIMLVNVYIENCTISCSHFTIIASVITLSYQFLTLALTFLLWPLSCLITPHKHPILHLFISLPLPPSPSSHIYDCKYLDDYVTVE